MHQAIDLCLQRLGVAEHPARLGRYFLRLRVGRLGVLHQAHHVGGETADGGQRRGNRAGDFGNGGILLVQRRGDR